MTTELRPNIVEDEHLIFLDNLRESGVMNMMGAAPTVEENFDVTIAEARVILGYWMTSFEERHPN